MKTFIKSQEVLDSFEYITVKKSCSVQTSERKVDTFLSVQLSK